MTSETVPVAYVTKWATTSNILTVRNGEVRDGGFLWDGRTLIPPQHWTTDKATAEARWREALEDAAVSAERIAAKHRERLAGPARYGER